MAKVQVSLFNLNATRTKLQRISRLKSTAKTVPPAKKARQLTNINSAIVNQLRDFAGLAWPLLSPVVNIHYALIFAVGHKKLKAVSHCALVSYSMTD